MPISVTMPALSPTMEEGNLAKWHVKLGDRVSSGDVIAEIETDKATMEVEAVDEGIVGKIVVPEGAEGVKVNAVIALLLEEGEDAASISNAPDAGEAKTESKSSNDSKLPPSSSTEAIRSASPSAPDEGGRILASPLARRIARENGLDMSAIKGSGPRGRIVKADVEAVQSSPKKTPRPEVGNVEVSKAASSFAQGPSSEQVKKLYGDRSFEEVPLDGMRKTIAARLTEAKQTIPHFYLRRDIELDSLLKFRADLNQGLQAKGVKLSVNDFVIKACALALQDVGDCNAAWAGDRILRFKASDVAVAVAIEGGLITPVIRDADTKTISAISKEMKDLAARAKARKLAPTEYQGGSFAISNLGMMGVENFDAVINPPHGSILAVGAGIRKPIIRNDEIVIATVMSVTLSVDHRVIDGALGAEYLQAIKGYLEEPISMLT